MKEALMQKLSFAPVLEKNAIKGKVIYVDTYKNVITNITEALFKENKGKALI